jgi:hypothetical protein
MAPRIVIATLAMAFAFAAVAATVTTVRQSNRQAWHAVDTQSFVAMSESNNEPS